MYYNNGYDSTYEELITFYPAFYREVKEIKAILEAQGEITDGVIADINRVIENSFIATADETMITRLEKFLGLPTDTSKSLEDRRQAVSVCFYGFGKLSASKLKETLKAFSGVDCNIKFAPADEAGNNRLDIAIPNPKRDFDPQVALDLLAKRLPAHLWYKVNISRNHDGTMFIGFVLRLTKKVEVGCNPTTFDPATFLADEDGNILANEAGAWLSI
ncbi:MAG: DUF2313 domain-containing protein [Rikenellaceae bacterium]|nr:DUF2313 domain-containing protein [Rikenellaceae bacterium]